MLTASSDETQPEAANAGEEIVLSGGSATILVRQRAVDIIEVIDAPTSEEPLPEQP